MGGGGTAAEKVEDNVIKIKINLDGFGVSNALPIPGNNEISSFFAS